MSSASCPGGQPSTLVLKGDPLSPGVVAGCACLWKDRNVTRSQRPAAGPSQEWDRLAAAVKEAREQLGALSDRVAQRLGPKEAGIFDAQAVILDDSLFVGCVRTAIEQNGVSAEEAVRKAVDGLVERFEHLSGERMRERAADISDLGKRILTNLSGTQAEPALRVHCAVLFAEDLTPSETACLDGQSVVAIVTERGGVTSHAAILARALGIPAVVVKGALAQVRPGDTVIVDGGSGEVTLHPPADLLNSCRAAQQRLEETLDSALRRLPATTLDGFPMVVGANIGGPREAAPAVEAGADCVGLLRSEFLFIGREGPPSEDEQFQAYKEVPRAPGAPPGDHPHGRHRGRQGILRHVTPGRAQSGAGLTRHSPVSAPGIVFCGTTARALASRFFRKPGDPAAHGFRRF